MVLERNPFFWSCPISNKWLIDIVDNAYLMHDMLGPAQKYGYTLVQTEVMQIERDKKIVRTSKGAISYDYLILSMASVTPTMSGSATTRPRRTIAHALPSAYIPSAEAMALKQKVRNSRAAPW